MLIAEQAFFYLQSSYFYDKNHLGVNIMSMTSASAQYFDQVAGQWDQIRSGYFTEAVRKTAIQKAYLRPDMDVADVGAGTGFLSAGLAPLVHKVYALDGSAAMLEVARQKLKDFDNIVFEEAEGLALPLPDASLDAVFANMYLHHCEDPQAAIVEMARLLRPGGRLVITDLDAHTHEWMRDEMADVWLGFEREQVRNWFEQAGLVNTIVDCTGESCCAESECDAASAEQRLAQIGVFVAVGTKRLRGVQNAVRDHYGALAEQGGSCCSPASDATTSCCGEAELISLEALSGENNAFAVGYTPLELAEIPADATEISLGCGNPTAFASMQPGQVVLDIGSGGGIDVFLAAKKVGPDGKAIGVDMTPSMLERARRTAENNGLTNVEFRQGQADSLPVEDGSVDLIISNCVINLTEDKGRVFREAYRALKNGSRLSISDVVTSGSLSAAGRQSAENWGGCVYGALPEQEYLDLIAQAGFTDIQCRRSAQAGWVDGVQVYSAQVSAQKSTQP
jgi:ubiquinone/menaquinone biosynthesis C-methylase UbiE